MFYSIFFSMNTLHQCFVNTNGKVVNFCARTRLEAESEFAVYELPGMGKQWFTASVAGCGLADIKHAMALVFKGHK